MENQNSYSHILKYIGLFGGVQGLNVLVGLVRNKFVALLLGPSGMGLLALFSSTIKLIGDSTNLGLSVSAIREMSVAYDHGDQATLRRKIDVFRHWCVLTSLLGLLICALLAPLLSRWTFSFGNHTLHFVLLSPVVAMTTFSAGELAILKATRRLREVAVSSVLAAILSLIIIVPIYYFLGQSGIVPSLLLMLLLQTVAVVKYSFRAYPFHIGFSMSALREGSSFLKLGIAFVLAGMAGSGAEMVIRSYLSYVDDIGTVGLYNSAYVMIFTYSGMIFTAMETDYFPRLSSVASVGREFNNVVNSQIEMSLHLISPMIVAFIIAMPLLLPLLYSGKFMTALPLVQVASLSMYARAMYLPIEYMALARGDSGKYMLLEATNALLLTGSVIIGYNCLGLFGTGVGIAVASFVELLFSSVFYRVCYGYHVTWRLLKVVVLHVGIGLLACATALTTGLWAYIGIGVVLFAADFAYSASVIRKHVDVLDAIKRRLFRKKH